ncbi:50S ribosomal protein L25/general stress protein Ctc [Candidatus Nucleicultrix amoebiphila]|jgi:large subunit ribosomal protein L25|uniref:Large ribosomal subunit protein bL25 n=1 Tax=Candidatus Nucleicultrix amoebiphila FS5 TaxID=1414854 RepID=A0A1W6N3X6_9PROT|nr:50S ribosomal protein L25/general stress protein Ctc [Candidatus Nucleicultrix amoebiphila]ARN84587.1 hypothetical protein GQ61_03845 [Candidatus Nucleicultrix amoebiphila FS5]
MTTTATMRVQSRENIGRGGSQALRRQGLVPGVIYGAGKDNVNFAIDERDVVKGLNDAGFFTHIFDLKIGNVSERGLAREVQLHPVTDRPIHIDFLRVGKDSKVNVAVPVTFINEDKSPGLKRGGVLNIVLHNLELVCPADHIPDHLTVDLTGVEIGHGIHVESLNLPAGISVAHKDRDNTIATIVAPTIQKAETEAAPVEGAATAAPAEGDKSKSE